MRLESSQGENLVALARQKRDALLNLLLAPLNNWKKGVVRMGVTEVIEGLLLRRESSNRLGWRRSVHSCIGIRSLGAAVRFF